jgi:tRNA nucleotidyltransferase/poly(A) polymerase
MNTNFIENLKQTILIDTINNDLMEFCSTLKNVEIYLVGGYLRDLLLHKDTVDKDYCIKGISGIEMAKILAEKFDGHFVLLDKENDIGRVVLPDKLNYLDIARCVNDDINIDLARRDFTINSMAIKLDNGLLGNFYDPYNGYNDLLNKHIRIISEQNIIDDPLRILRAYRIGAQISGSIDKETDHLIHKHYHLLKNVAAERIHTEFNKLFINNNSYEYLQKMSNYGILEFIIPEMTELHRVPPNIYHHLGLFDHTLEVYKGIENQVTVIEGHIKSHLYTNISPSIKRIIVLKYAALLHDIAKPQTWKIDEITGKHTFLGHSDQGAELAGIILKRLKLPNIAIKKICKLIKYHLYPSQLAPHMEVPTKKASLRFFRKLGEETPEAILLAISDRLAAQGPKISQDVVNNRILMLQDLMKQYYESLEEKKKLPGLLNGNDVMTILNIKPSPKVGKALNKIRELQEEGLLTTSEEASQWLIENYK